ncbi:hypothetical protein [Rufibacter tibetensis]|uniref:YcxB-like protein domain-containing protein n=1 Tax=Rufibacter tibetensis TaxID=512763 RepID=A0A0P0C8S1_9BACT|nr:hypothetical protein [Rufibacter tibetensis]ALJ01704.1 hypothetical protein DC20_21895 [Rufibacter tibetensis]
MQPFSVTTQLTPQDFLQFYKRANPGVLVLTWVFRVIGIFLLLSVPLQYTSTATSHLPFPFVNIFAGLAMVGLPVLQSFSGRRSFASNSKIQESITYTFTDKNLFIAGETFTNNLTLATLHKVTQTKDLVLFWDAPQQVAIIPKRSLSREELTWLQNQILPKK